MEKTIGINKTFIKIGTVLLLGSALSCAEPVPEETQLGSKSQALTGESVEASSEVGEARTESVKQPPADINAEMDRQPSDLQYRYYQAQVMSYEQVVATYKEQLANLKEQEKERDKTPGNEQLVQDMETQIKGLEATLKEKQQSLTLYKQKLKKLEQNAS